MCIRDSSIPLRYITLHYSTLPSTHQQSVHFHNTVYVLIFCALSRTYTPTCTEIWPSTQPVRTTGPIGRTYTRILAAGLTNMPRQRKLCTGTPRDQLPRRDLFTGRSWSRRPGRLSPCETSRNKCHQVDWKATSINAIDADSKPWTCDGNRWKAMAS